MWILTRAEWPTLVNLAVVARVDYRQLTKNDPRTRVVAFAADQEMVLVDCESGEQARAVVQLIAQHLNEGKPLLDLSRLDLSRLTAGTGARAEDGWV